MLGVILARSKFALHQFYVKCHSNLAASSKPGRRRRSQRPAAKPKADESVEITLMFTGAVVQTAIRSQGVELPQGGPSRPDSMDVVQQDPSRVLPYPGIPYKQSSSRPGGCPPSMSRTFHWKVSVPKKHSIFWVETQK